MTHREATISAHLPARLALSGVCVVALGSVIAGRGSSPMLSG